MAIKNIDDNLRTRCIGKLRLGVIKPGTSYPMDVPYFVTKDAPEVEAVYGKEPTSIEVFFAAPTVDESVPYFYKWWSGGSKDKDGNLIGGKIQCSGDGVTADHHLKRDPNTRIVPTRPCLGEKCPDWNAPNGNAQCRPQMTIKVWIPRVSLLGYYELDTKSIMNINNILGVLRPLADRAKSMNGGSEDLRGIPFTMTRTAVKIDTVDPKTGKAIKTTHWPIVVRPLEPKLFTDKYGKELAERSRSYTLAHIAEPSIGSDVLEPAPQIEHIAEVQKGPVVGIELVAEDADLAPMFTQLTSLIKKNNTPKLRLLTARKFEQSENPKEALQNYLQEQIIANKKTPDLPPPATTQQATPSPQPNSDGLI